MIKGIARRLRGLSVAISATMLTAVRGLLANRMRAFLSTIGVAIGVATLTTIYGLVSGLTSSFTEQLSMLGSNTMYVTSRPWVIRGDWWAYRNRPPITFDDVESLQAADALLAVAPIAEGGGEISYLSQRIGVVQVEGTTSDYMETSRLKIDAGRFLSPVESSGASNVTVIGSEVKEKLFVGGDPIGAQINLGPQRFTVIGVLKPQGKAFGNSLDNLIIIPIGSFSRVYGNRRDMAIAIAADPDRLNEAEEQIIEVLRRGRSLPAEEPDTFSINRQSELIRVFNEETEALFGVAIAVGLITLLVGGIGVMNIMLVAVTERTREIGVRRALGARRKTILFQFLIESSLVTLVGGAAGTVIGVVATIVIDKVSPVGAELSPGAVVGALLFSAVIGLVFGTWPAQRAAGLDPIESLRYE